MSNKRKRTSDMEEKNKSSNFYLMYQNLENNRIKPLILADANSID